MGVSVTSIRVGLPGALFSYSFNPFWERFFEALGVEVVHSGPTTREMLDDGVREAVSEACVPIKVYHGHVRNLASRSDALFIPRYVSVDRGTVFCPKFLGLPDMIRFSMKDIPRVVSPRVDMRKGRLGLGFACLSVASELGLPRTRAISAWLYATRSQASAGRPAAARAAGEEPAIVAASSREGGAGAAPAGSRLRIAVLGYPYAVYDRFLNMDLLRKLARLGVDVLTVESLPSTLLNSSAGRLAKRLFWHYSDRVVRAAFRLIDTSSVAGLIHVTAFGCGPDALADRLIDLESSKNGMPFMPLLIDENSGEAGLVTRLEAFVDMVRRSGALSRRPAAHRVGGFA